MLDLGLYLRFLLQAYPDRRLFSATNVTVTYEISVNNLHLNTGRIKGPKFVPLPLFLIHCCEKRIIQIYYMQIEAGFRRTSFPIARMSKKGEKSSTTKNRGLTIEKFSIDSFQNGITAGRRGKSISAKEAKTARHVLETCRIR
jgi:hypothetical protein